MQDITTAHIQVYLVAPFSRDTRNTSLTLHSDRNISLGISYAQQMCYRYSHAKPGLYLSSRDAWETRLSLKSARCQHKKKIRERKKRKTVRKNLNTSSNADL